MPYVAYFMKNQSLHGGFILPIQLDNFFLFRSKPRSAVKRCRPARAVAQPQIENNIRLDAVFKKPLYIARKLVGHGDKGVSLPQRRVPVEQHVDYGQHVIIEIIFPRIPFAFFAKLRRNRAGVCSPCIQLKGAVLKAAGYFIKVFIILIALFLRFSQIILPALTYAFSPSHSKPTWQELLRGRLPVNSSKLWSGYIFLQYSCAKISISRGLPARDTGTDIDLRYLAYIRRSRTIFSAERRRSRRASSVAVRNDDNLAPVCKKRGANALP